MMMPGRSYSAESGYRYGFNGKENDNEVKGEGNQQDYGMRIYDPRIGKFLSCDPLTKNYPWFTPYQFAGNTPIQAIDLDGEEPKMHYEKHSSTAGYHLWQNYYPSVHPSGSADNSKTDWSVYSMTDNDGQKYWVRYATTGGGNAMDQFRIWEWAPINAKSTSEFKSFTPTGYSNETARDIAIGMKGADEILLKTFAIALASPFVVEGGLAYLGTLGEAEVARRIGSAGADFLFQTAKNGGKFWENNYASTIGDLVTGNPLLSSFIGSGGQMLADKIVNPSDFNGKDIKELGLETLFGYLGNKFGDTFTSQVVKHGKVTELGANFLVSLIGGLNRNVITEAAQQAEKKVEKSN